MSRDITGAFVFGIGGNAEDKDQITILATSPEAGSAMEAGRTPPIFAFVEYELATNDDSEVFLELSFQNAVEDFPAGQVLSTSDSYRIRRGKARIGCGEGNDKFLKIDPFDLPDTSSPLILRAWIGER